MNLTVRPALSSDRDFIEQVYFETQRWIIERLFGWRGDEIERQKFDSFYRQDLTKMICLDESDVGWMTVTSDSDGVELNQIYLLPRAQNRGIGTMLIRNIIDGARSSGRPVKLSTAKINPARKLYERLGFEECGESEFKIFMEVR